MGTETSIAVGFPGQGGDWRSALRTLAAHPDHPLVTELAEHLGTGEWDRLDQLDTRSSQPVVFTAGLVAADAAGLRPGDATVAIGHSLGEITAACFAGAIAPGDGLRLVVRRAELGHQSHAERPGAMVAVMRLEQAEVEWIRRSAIAEETGVLDIAVRNSPTQFVLSGDAAPAQRAVALAESLGGVARPLPIGGAFHSPLMFGAVAPYAELLAGAVTTDPAVPIVASTSPRPITTAAAVRDVLARALVLPVDWLTAVASAAEAGADRGIDVGPGDTLARLARFAPGLPFEPLAPR